MTLTLTNILKEKRKRFQVYTTLDFLISMITPFDFFSKETFEIFMYTLHLYTLLKPKKFSYLLFFISCFEKGKISKELLNNNNITLENLLKKLETHDVLIKTQTENKDLMLFNILSFLELKQIKVFLNKLVENTQNRFKTPLISEEIFLITLLELTKGEDATPFFLQNTSKIDYLNIRYKLLKKLHNIETVLKIKIPQNFLFFSYLTQMQFSWFESNNLLFTDDQKAGVLFFRNRLILECLNSNILTDLKKQIYQTISTKRKYTLI